MRVLNEDALCWRKRIYGKQENNAVNILAQLLDYKNAHFAEFNPMDEFTLDLIRQADWKTHD